MNALSWEQLQNIANNMLKSTNNPNELFRIYINKMYSLLLDSPAELHPYMIQALRDTGMFDDPVLTRFFNELFSGNVVDMRRSDVLMENKQMIGVYGGQRRSKLNKRKNKFGGKPKEGEENQQPSDPSSALIVASQPGALMVAANPGALANRTDPHLEDVAPGFQIFNFNGKRIRVKIVNNMMYGPLMKAWEQKKIDCERDEKRLIDEMEKEIKELETQLKEKRENIQKKFDNAIQLVNDEYKYDMIWWAVGCIIYFSLRMSPINQDLNFLDYQGTIRSKLGPVLAFIMEFVLIGGIIGGLLKSCAHRELSLAEFNTDQSKMRILWDAIKWVFGQHVGFHMVILAREKKALPTGLNIFELPDYIKFQDEIREKQEKKRGYYMELIAKLRDKCKKDLDEYEEKLTKLGADVEIFDIVSTDTPESSQPQSHRPPLLIKDGQPGGMKKLSKKHIKKTRKSRYYYNL
jgi:hypothetical protein